MLPGQECFQGRDAWGKGALMEQTNSNLRGGKALRVPQYGVQGRLGDKPSQVECSRSGFWSGSKSLVLSHKELRGVLED